MVEKRYQVFVSSTYQDLVEERQHLIQALLQLDCIPAGMEMFPAANQDQWTLIKRIIDDSDYYVLVIAGRYGSVALDGESYTEKEYRYALLKEKPIIAFVHRGQLPLERVEDDPAKQVKLDAFIRLAENKLVKYWATPAELGGVVSRSLHLLMRDYPANGWVRAGPQQAAARVPQYAITLAPPRDMPGFDVSRLDWDRDKCFAIFGERKFRVRPVLSGGASFEIRLGREIVEAINDEEPMELELVDKRGHHWETRPFFVNQQSVALSYLDDREDIIASYGGAR
jgi:Domain of unknown function (DUF4062)